MLEVRDHSKAFHVGRLIALAAIAIFVSSLFDPAQAQQPGQTTFASADKARRIGRNEFDTIQVCHDNVLFIRFLFQLGPLLAPANTEDYEKVATERQPLSGYYYRILTSQGRHAPGGAKNYVVDGRMTGGFAFVAYPAEYRSSGVMTFIISLDGIVYQKDMGPGTARIAKTMTQYDPDRTWKKVKSGYRSV